MQWDFIGADSDTFDTINKTTLAHMELAVLDRALNAAPSNRHSIPLVLEQIKVASTSGIWDAQKVDGKWQELFSWTSYSLASLVDVWHAFIAYRKSNSSDFRVDDILGLYAAALKEVEAAAKENESLLLDTCRLDLISSLCNFLQTAGYAEWGTAILQAELEILVCMVRESIPANLQQDDFLDLFCVWWDDDPCHISDVGEYRGFSHATWKRPVVSLDMEFEDQVGPSKQDRGDDLESWRQNELEQGKRLQPREITSTNGEPDPYSFILAADIRTFLFIPASYPEPILLKALDSFTEYLNMPRNWISQTSKLGYLTSSEQNVEYMYNIATCLDQMSLPEAFWTESCSLKYCKEPNIIKMPCSIDVLFPRTQHDPRGEWFTIMPDLSKAIFARVERCLLQIMKQPLSRMKDPVDSTEIYLALPLSVLYASKGDSKRYVMKD